MYKIVKKKVLNDQVVLMEIDAPFIAKKAEAGQFIIYRIDEKGERIPLTIADYDREKRNNYNYFSNHWRFNQSFGITE